MTLIPILGIVGTSFGKALSIIVGFGFVMYNLKRVFGWHFDVEALKKSWISAVIMGSIVLIVQQYLVGLLYFPLYILIGGASYFVLLRLLHVVNTSDIALVRRFLPKRLEFAADILALLLICEQ